MDEQVATCQDLLKMINSEKNSLDKIITGGESWCFGYDLETKHQSSEWVDKPSL
jgi:hypothetical protein